MGDVEVRLHGEFDAEVWAREFVKIAAVKPEIAQSEGTMVGWFANAIMAGYDRGQSDASHALAAGSVLGESTEKENE